MDPFHGYRRQESKVQGYIASEEEPTRKEGPVKDGGTRVLVCAKDPQSSEIYVGRDWTNSG